MSTQALFADSLLNPELSCPPGLKTWNGSDPQGRLAVYRNNVVVSLVDALADTFPVTLALVGEDFFRAMARVYVQTCPPRTRILTWLGTDFPTFVETFEPARGLPWLADVARIEMQRVVACHAADAQAVQPEELSSALSDPENVGALRLQLHPSLQVLNAPHAAFALWAAHQLEHAQCEQAVARIDTTEAQNCMIFRSGLEVLVQRLSEGDACFLASLRDGLPLGEAAGAAMGQDADFDLSGLMAGLIHHQLIVGLSAGLTAVLSADST